jgi:hypothetical protein
MAEVWVLEPGLVTLTLEDYIKYKKTWENKKAN